MLFPLDPAQLVRLALAQIEAGGIEAGPDAPDPVDPDATEKRLARHAKQRARASISEPEQTERDLRAFIGRLGLRYFAADEVVVLCARVTASGVKNEIPPPHLWGNLALALRYADEIRHRTGSRGRLSSLYRAPAYNRAVGGAGQSLHVDAAATDVHPLDTSVQAWAVQAARLRGERLAVPATLFGTFTPTRRRSVLDVDGLRVRRTGKSTSFVVAGGIGRYPRFVHTDVRGEDVDF